MTYEEIEKMVYEMTSFVISENDIKGIKHAIDCFYSGNDWHRSKEETQNIVKTISNKLDKKEGFNRKEIIEIIYMLNRYTGCKETLDNILNVNWNYEEIKTVYK